MTWKKSDAALAAIARDDDDIIWLEANKGKPTNSRHKRERRRGRRHPSLKLLTLTMVSIGLAAGVGSSAPSTSAAAHDSYDDAAPGHHKVELASIIRLSLPPSVQAMLPLPTTVVDQPLLALRSPPDPSETLRFGSVAVRRDVVETVWRAGSRTEVDPVYLMALADKESSFSAHAKAPTSSAEGMFQFIDKTWLRAVKEFGPIHGLGEEAAKIEVLDDKIKVEPAERERILAIRRDPYLSAVMAAELLKRDRADVSTRIGRDLSKPEYYLCHFLGFEQAARFMQLLNDSPEDNAAKAFPSAARANTNLFYTREKKRKLRGKTIAEVYQKLIDMMDRRIDRYASMTDLVTR
ncbi:transglycosylase SLT domain-containing protein [Chelatococcus reniformis]|uniref:Transglycosylase SLT domain-containing protein n=1 Tax=Chelatococcus reniformis TaxID=1494448 RepID=A0A916X9T4_9HYPH|nr:transglycosylase SLT domain-containing protein [Chelatococcus reniformis]GGC55318.1 hypothetical protein GCM10010994_12760 [Chelatococcus reniformis]